MAKKKISQELEQSILEMPVKEKNKLLIRLINKDGLLIDKLQYLLLENTEADLKYRVGDIKEGIDKYFKSLPATTFKALLSNTKNRVIEINRHAKVTKDQKGELELLIYLFLKSNAAYGNCRNILKDWLFRQKYKEYAITKIKKMKSLLEAIHEDYRIEFAEDLESIETFVEKI